MTDQSTLRVLNEDELSLDTVLAFTGAGQAPRVSLYLPTHSAGRDITQDPIRFRRLVSAAAAELGDADGLLGSLRDLVGDTHFWAHGSAGLGVLVDDHGTVAVRLRDTPPELAVVSDRLHLKPLLPGLSRVGEFEVLALSQHDVRLVRVSCGGVEEVGVPDMPRSLPDALRWDDREPQLTSHAAGRVGVARVTASFHGQGDAGDARTADLVRFLRIVDRALVRRRGDSTSPLVLAGVDEVVAEFRGITRCRHVADGHLGGNADREPARELAACARPLLEPIAVARQDRAREALLTDRALTVDAVELALVAATEGRVATIFVPSDRERWGRPTPGAPVPTGERRPGDVDLGDLAAVETLRHGGEAFVVPYETLPGGGSAAALLRF